MSQEPPAGQPPVKARYFSTFQLILLALFAALIVVAKVALRLPLQMPGHSGIFWMAIMVVASGVVPKAGAPSLVGLTSGILAAFLGLGTAAPWIPFSPTRWWEWAPTWRCSCWGAGPRSWS